MSLPVSETGSSSIRCTTRPGVWLMLAFCSPLIWKTSVDLVSHTTNRRVVAVCSAGSCAVLRGDMAVVAAEVIHEDREIGQVLISDREDDRVEVFLVAADPTVTEFLSP